MANECVDVDECSQNLCDEEATCSNNIGSYECQCSDGYHGDGTKSGTGCSDVNECTQPMKTGLCQQNASCANTEGSFSCICNTGFTDNGGVCVDSINSYSCSCKDNWMGENCDIPCDYCQFPEKAQNNRVSRSLVGDKTSPCLNGQCINTPNNYKCECAPGYGWNYWSFTR